MVAAGELVEVASRVFSGAGLALLVVAIVHLIGILGASAARAARAWWLALRHMRRAAAARDAARRSRERFVREHAATGAYGYLRLLRDEDGEARREDDRA